jgi:hypothetical protein
VGNLAIFIPSRRPAFEQLQHKSNINIHNLNWQQQQPSRRREAAIAAADERPTPTGRQEAAAAGPGLSGEAGEAGHT